MREKIDNKLIQRAVELWCRKLYQPVFDNGDDSGNGALSHALATMNIQNDRSQIDNIQERVEVFRDELTKVLIETNENENEYLDPYLSVDYHPCMVLADAAEKAGIPESQFSCKSSIYIGSDSISVSFGYGAENIKHYPLPDGGWLLTTLSGSDMKKIITHVVGGNLMGLVVEQP